ncbi:hypothetical protein [Mycolicibacterium sp. XJ870]
MRVTFVRGRLRLVGDSPSSVSVRVRGGTVGVDDSGVVDGDVSDGEVPDVVPETSVGGSMSVVIGSLVLVMVPVVVAVVLVVVVDRNVGSMNSVGACCGWSALLVRVTRPHTTRAITVSAATLALSTAGVE